MSGGGDETAGAHAHVTQDVGGSDHLPTKHNLEAPAQLAIPAGNGLHGLVAGSGGKAHRPEFAGRMRTYISRRVQHPNPEDGGLHPAVQRRRRAVLRSHHRHYRAVELGRH
jgi:subtilisin family serine protease